MWKLKADYVRKSLDNRCPMCQSEEDIIEHVLQCKKGDTKFNFNDDRGKEWREIVEIYKKNKDNRTIDNIGEEQNMLEG